MSARKKRLNADHEQSQDRWLVSYADFITLLFAFFVILYATSERNQEKTEKFQKSVDKFLVKAGAFGESGAKVQPGEKNFSVLEPPIQTHRPAGPDDVRLMEAVESQLESQLSQKERRKFLIDLFPEEKGLRMILSGQDLFSGDSAKFTAEAMAFVDHLGEILKAQKKPLMVEGHVSEGHHGEFASAWDLASARAINTIRYFQKKYDFAPEKTGAATFGDSRPLSSKKGMGRNDRLEVLIYFNDAEF